MISLRCLPLAACLTSASLCPAADTPVETLRADLAVTRPTPVAAPPPAIVRDARGGQLIAACKVEGKVVNMIVDTGATHTTLDETFTRVNFPSLNVSEVSGPYRTNAPKAPKMTRASLLVDSLAIEKHPILLLDLSSANGILQTPVHGVLGMNTMGCLPFVFNVRDKIFRYDAGLKPTPDMKKLRGRLDENNRLVVDARAGGKHYALLLDTGASATLLTKGAWQGKKGAAVALDSASVKGRSKEEVLLAGPADFEIGDGLVLEGVTPMLVDERLSNDPQTVGLLGLDSLRGVELYYFPPAPGKQQEPGGFYARRLDASKP